MRNRELGSSLKKLLKEHPHLAEWLSSEGSELVTGRSVDRYKKGDVPSKARAQAVLRAVKVELKANRSKGSTTKPLETLQQIATSWIDLREGSAAGKSDASLRSLAKRLSKLRTTQPDVLRLKSILVGAVYALHQAHSLGYEDNYHLSPNVRVEDLIEEVLKEIENGRIPRNAWLAGFYFNAAILRLDTFRERIAQLPSASAQESDQAVPEEESCLEKVRQDYASFRSPEGLAHRRITPFATAKGAAREATERLTKLCLDLTTSN